MLQKKYPTKGELNVTRLRLQLVLIALTAILSGCATFQQKTPIYMIEQKDILPVEKGQVFTAPDLGWFISDFYLSEVIQAKVDKAKRTT